MYGFLVFQVLLGGIGIFFNLTRLKRKTDRMRLTLVLSVVLGILWLVIISFK
jgi:predicted membrane channel-forming protein YqfA (hemolysin III family)